MKYRIANLIIESDAALSDDWAAFAWESETEGVTPELVARVLHVIHDVTLELGAQVSHPADVSHPTLQHPQFSTTQVEDGWIYEYKADGGSVMQVDKDYTRVRLAEGEGSEYLLRLAVECRLIRDGYISLHGACVVAPDGRAIIFTGNSGVGKSTRAAAWSTALNLKMISGDRPLIWTGAKCNTRPDLVLQADTACRAFGVPWDGKEGIHVNMNSPISVIFNVIRAKRDECEIRELSSLEALRILMAQTFLPMWDTDLAAQAMGNLKTLIESGIKIADLVSGWDEAAALKAWETISPSLSGTAST